jgi:Porin subfamily
MKTIKSLILGSAAGLLAMSGAQAADLPIKAKPVEYVRICSLYGAGFYYIPGTDTCIKLGGYLRVDVLANTNGDATGNTSGAGAANNRFTNAYTWRSREDLSIDTRTATEYGVVRTFADLTFSWTSDTYAGNGAGGTLYGAVGTAAGPNNAATGNVAAGTLGAYYAFIQFAGFMIGKGVSAFSAPWANYPGNNFDGLVGGGGAITGVNQFTYTAELGGGVSATISAQDPSAYYQAGVNNLLVGGAYGAPDYAGTVAPDIIGVIKVEQAWGLFQGSVAAHDNNAAYYGSTEPTGHPDDKWGWAGQLALSINNIPTGPGDVISVQAVYTDGATRYNIQDLASSAGANTIFGGTNVPGAYQSIGFGMAPDSVFGALSGVNTSQQLIQTWGGRGAYTHNWDPYWNSGVYGAYAAVNYNSTATALICGVGGSFRAIYGGVGSNITSCNPNYSISQVGFITRWTPVKNLTFSGDITYTHLDQNNSGTIAYPGSAAIGKPAAVYALANQDTLTVLLRAQRNW